MTLCRCHECEAHEPQPKCRTTCCESSAEPGSKYCRECNDARAEDYYEAQAEARREMRMLGEDW